MTKVVAKHLHALVVLAVGAHCHIVDVSELRFCIVNQITQMQVATHELLQCVSVGGVYAFHIVQVALH